MYIKYLARATTTRGTIAGRRRSSRGTGSRTSGRLLLCLGVWGVGRIGTVVLKNSAGFFLKYSSFVKSTVKSLGVARQIYSRFVKSTVGFANLR